MGNEAFRIGTCMVAVASLTACTTVRVGYGVAPTAAGDQITSADANSYPFRIPRSQLAVKFTGSGFQAAVLDAVATDPNTDPTPLPGNPGYGYRIAIVQTGGPTLTKQQFFELVGTKKVKVFPVAACAVATLTLFQKGGTNQVTFTATVVPSELALPTTTDAVPSTSQVYIAKPASDVVSTTNLSVTYIDNTKLVSKIGSSVTDNISTTLKDVTAIAVAAASVAAPAMVGADTSWHNVGTAVVTVAANDAVEAIPIPRSGTVVMNSTCGASTTSTASTSGADQAAQNLAAAIADAQQIYKAWKGK